MNKLQQISKYFTHLSECACDSAPMDISPMPPQNFQPNPQLSPNQLNDPDFIAQIVAQIIQQMQNPGGMQINEQLEQTSHDKAINRLSTNPKTANLPKKEFDALLDKTSKSFTKPSQVVKKVIDLKMDSQIGEPVTVEYDPKKNLTDVTISWGNESHTVDFEAGDVIDDHGNEGMDIETMADSEDGRWQFILDVYAEATFPMTGDFAEWDFDELIVQGHPDNEDHLEPEDRSNYDNGDELGSAMAEGMMCEECGEVHEGTCGYTQTADGKKLKTPGGTKGVSGFNRTNFMRNQQN